MHIGSKTVADFGRADFNSRTVAAIPPVQCAQKGITVFPEKSYSSRKVKTGIGRLDQQFGNPR